MNHSRGRTPLPWADGRWASDLHKRLSGVGGTGLRLVVDAMQVRRPLGNDTPLTCIDAR
jgi:hypothetical protein